MFLEEKDLLLVEGELLEEEDLLLPQKKILFFEKKKISSSRRKNRKFTKIGFLTIQVEIGEVWGFPG